VARGGSQRLAEALAAYLRELGGAIVTGRRIDMLDELRADAVLCDVGPRQWLRLAGGGLPGGYSRRLARYRYGPGVFKVDWALDGPIPWSVAECEGAGTIHIGGTLEDIADAEEQVWQGLHPERPFVILVQAVVADPTRAPQGRHTGWAYCHVPNGSTVDMTGRIEAQVERFAPGFRNRILARRASGPSDLEAYNPNYVGGDINGGVQDLRQLYARPASPWRPYATPRRGVFLCSASTPPGGGVHGMCGYHAAQTALRHLRSGLRRV
jgi:phytoene dehydrogenase-like protein